MGEIKIESSFNLEEKRVWDILLKTQKEIESYFHPAWTDNNHRIDYSKPVDVEDIAIPNWRVVFINGKSTSEKFFQRLSNGIFNVNAYLRNMKELHYLPTRCRWHDSYGHLPFLFNREYSNSLKFLAQCYNLSHLSEEAKNQLELLYWAVYEFGVFNGEKILGAGIISSPAESKVVINNLKERKNYFDLSYDFIRSKDALEYVTDTFQSYYINIESFNQVEQIIIQIIQDGQR